MNGRPWTRTEDDAVREAFACADRRALRDVADRINRSIETVRFRAYKKLGLRRAKQASASVEQMEQDAIANAYRAWHAQRGAA